MGAHSRLVSWLAVVALFASADAHACGAYFSQSTRADSASSMNAQEALYVVRADHFELTLQASAENVDAGFAWVVPVPALDPDKVSLGDPDLFDTLDAFTRPEVHEAPSSSGGSSGGCGSCAPGEGSVGRSAPDLDSNVQHLGGGRVGDYEFDILAATSADEMITWLTDAGYQAPEGSAELLQPYADAGMQFLWAKISAEALTEEEIVLDPLRLEIPFGGTPVFTYPLSLSALSASPISTVVLHVLAHERFHVSNFENQDFSTVAESWGAKVDDGRYLSVTKAVDELTETADGQLAITDYSKDLSTEEDLPETISALIDDDAHVLTRLFLRVPKDKLADLTLSALPGGGEVENHYYLSSRSSPLSVAHVGALILFFALRIFYRQRSD